MYSAEISEDLRKDLVDAFLPYYQEIAEDVALFKKDKPWCSTYLKFIEDLSITLGRAVNFEQSSVYFNLPIVGKIAVLIAMCSGEDQSEFRFDAFDPYQKLCVLTELLLRIKLPSNGGLPLHFDA